MLTQPGSPFGAIGDPMPPAIPHDRFLGCLLGQAVGDALGAPFEGLPAGFVFWPAGALCGAYLGAGAIPARWTGHLEDGPKGVGSLRSLADGLHRLHVRLVDG